ncbi:DUF6090 family protein [Flavobacteriaceae bacterium]|nr:DUF6090 family protein [Flavobacteriaceae bacterium]MDA9929380.1 DUF6090 family protein [Flavobacteriaceae bacterium]MDC1473965.1 DUF6090 family protein [Flavobacteriaceae bacterium]
MKKYLIKYSLEFLVIVMGISVSFWVNEWNNDRLNFTSHERDIKSLISDLKNDSIKYELVLKDLIDGEKSTKKIAKLSESLISNKISYNYFTNEIIKIGVPYQYQTFFMTDGNYKSLQADNKINLFSAGLQKIINNYYEFISKRIFDNNHLVDNTTINYYNNVHTFSVYYSVNKDDYEKVKSFKNYFINDLMKKKYSDINFLNETNNLLERILIYKRQISNFSNQRDELALALENYLNTVAKP